MSKLNELQETYDRKMNEQGDILKRMDEIVDGRPRGFSDGDEQRFNTLSTEIEGLKEQIRKETVIDNARKEQLMRTAAKVEAPYIGKKQAPATYIKATRAAITGDWSDAGAERELMQENARHAGRGWDKHVLIINPSETIDRADAYSVMDTAGDGGNLVGTNYRPDKFVDQLWNASILGRLPVKRNIISTKESIPVSTNKTTARMVAETAALGDSEKKTFDLLIANPNEMITKSAFSRKIDLMSDPAIRNLLQNEVFMAIADKLDAMFINGNNAAGELKGILKYSGDASDTSDRQISKVALSSNALTLKKLVEMQVKLGKKNVGGDLRFICNTQTEGALMTTLKDSANTSSGYILGDNMRLIGKPYIVSQNVPGNLTVGADKSALILGNFSETEIYQFGNIAIEFDPYTGIDNSLVYLRSFSFWDFIHKRLGNYCIIEDAATA